MSSSSLPMSTVNHSVSDCLSCSFAVASMESLGRSSLKTCRLSHVLGSMSEHVVLSCYDSPWVSRASKLLALKPHV